MEIISVHTDKLIEELAHLKEHVQEPYLSEERREAIQRDIAYISFELSERQRDGV